MTARGGARGRGEGVVRAEIKGGGWAVAEFSSDLSTKLTLKFLLCQEVPRGHSLPLSPSLSVFLWRIRPVTTLQNSRATLIAPSIMN